jgi:PAS domain S-box-containing protein
MEVSMFKRLFSLKNAIIIPFISLILLLVIIIASLWQFDYNWLSNEQGNKILYSLNENIKIRLNNMLSEPLRINQLLAAEIQREMSYGKDNAADIEDLIIGLTKNIHSQLPQISVVGYGDENKNFVALRVNDDDTFTLMLSDSRTENKLNIYNNESLESDIVASYEGYDPTTRPWYIPVKSNNLPQWSDIYINADELSEATISSLVPVFDNNETLMGVSSIDIKLSLIEKFLMDDKTKGNGIVYIVDDNWNIISQSTGEKNVKLIQGDTPSAEFIKASDSKNDIIRESTLHLLEQSNSISTSYKAKIKNEYYYILMDNIDQPNGLNWRIVSVIPESDLMGIAKKRQETMLVTIILITSLLALIGYFMLTKVIDPILKAAYSIKGFTINSGSESIIDIPGNRIYETEIFINSFNTMIKNLHESFKKLSVSEENYRSLIENSEDMIYSLDNNLNFISVNSSIEDILGVNRFDLIGRNIIEIFNEKVENGFWANSLSRVIETGVVFTTTYEYINQFGTKFYLKVTLIPVFNEFDEISIIIGTNSNITALIEAQLEIDKLHEKERHELEMLVSERTSELEYAMRELLEKEKLASLGSLVSGIAHEINTPLGVAVSAGSFMGNVLENGLNSMEKGTMTRNGLVDFVGEIQESTRIINTNLERAATLVNSFKQISINQTYEEISTFKLTEYINMVLISLKHEIKLRKIVVRINGPQELYIDSFTGAISQIMTNLIMNSLIHGYDKNQEGLIEIFLSENENSVLIEFKDDGKGIGEENIQKIFDPFFTTKRSAGGSGLGLNIVYNLVTGKLLGKISVKSEIGVGTTFSLDIPKNRGAK